MKLWQCSACREGSEDCGLQCQMVTDNDIDLSKIHELCSISPYANTFSPIVVWSEIQHCDLLVHNQPQYNQILDELLDFIGSEIWDKQEDAKVIPVQTLYDKINLLKGYDKP